jgi:hypothetical protein
MKDSPALKKNFRYLSRIRSKALFCLSHAWRWIVVALILFVPIVVSFLLSKFLDRFSSLEKEAFFVNCAEPVWGTCSATFGFFLSVFFIALTKQEKIFGKRYQNLYLEDLRRPVSSEYQLVYWEVVAFMNGLRCLIFGDSFSLFIYSLILGALSIVSFGIVFFALTLSDEAYWFRCLRHKGYFTKTPYFRRQSLSLPNLCEGRFKAKYSVLSSLWKVSSIADCITYFNKCLDDHESLYPDFDVFLFMLKKAPMVFDCDYDLFAFNASLHRLFALADRLDKEEMGEQAKELRVIVAECVIGLMNSPLIKRADTLTKISTEELRGLSKKKKDKISLLIFGAFSDCGVLASTFETVTSELMRGQSLVEDSYRHKFSEQFLQLQLKTQLFLLMEVCLEPDAQSIENWGKTFEAFPRQEKK